MSKKSTSHNQDMNHNVIVLLVSLAVIATLVVVIGLNLSSKKSNTVQITSSKNDNSLESKIESVLARVNLAKPKNKYTVAIDKDYMRSCAATTTTTKEFDTGQVIYYCGCLLLNFRDVYPLDQFLTLRQEYEASGQIPEDFNKTAAACLQYAEAGT